MNTSRSGSWMCKHPYTNNQVQYTIILSFSTYGKTFFSSRSGYCGKLTIKDKNDAIISNLTLEFDTINANRANDICSFFAIELLHVVGTTGNFLVSTTVTANDEFEDKEFSESLNAIYWLTGKLSISKGMSQFLLWRKSEYLVDSNLSFNHIEPVAISALKTG